MIYLVAIEQFPGEFSLGGVSYTIFDSLPLDIVRQKAKDAALKALETTKLEINFIDGRSVVERVSLPDRINRAQGSAGGCWGDDNGY